ncbi:MAG: hypothetical protein LKJ13_08495 [Clostridia bacterium]|nr:hypothetical protein [Clostridia bacterium]MCI2000958.1 hypothetical protein [Clostridia bacterium]MCI2015742.1 hypothetical protein [Clostridia bacterium]
MKTIENVFISVDDEEAVVYSLLKNIPVFNIYVIFADENGKIEIMKSNLFFKLENFEDMYVLGIAEGKYRAYRVVTEMFGYSSKKGWDADKTGICLIKEK